MSENMRLNTIANKFNNTVIEFSLQIDGKLYNICVFDMKFERMLYYQTYKYITEYCGDCVFEPIKNNFGDGKLFTTKELKIIFEIDCDDVDDYCLEKLFSFSLNPK